MYGRHWRRDFIALYRSSRTRHAWCQCLNGKLILPGVWHCMHFCWFQWDKIGSKISPVLPNSNYKSMCQIVQLRLLQPNFTMIDVWLFVFANIRKFLKGLNFDLKSILIMSLKILMGQIGDEKNKNCTLTTIHAMYFLNLIFEKIRATDSQFHVVFYLRKE